MIRNAEYKFGPLLLKDGRILAVTDRESPNLRIVEVHPRVGMEAELADLIPAGDSCIQHWISTGERKFVSYIRELKTTIDIFDSSGRRLGQLPTEEWDTVRLMGVSEDGEELFFERESFTKPIQICRYSPVRGQIVLWADRKMSIDPQDISHTEICRSPRRTGRAFRCSWWDVETSSKAVPHPTIMTSYGGYGVSS